MNLEPYDLVLAETRKGYKMIGLIFGYDYVRDKGIKIFPKYVPYNILRKKFYGHTWKMLGNEWSRVTYPEIVRKNSLTYKILRKYYYEFVHRKNSYEEFIIPESSIERVFSAREGAKKVLKNRNKKRNRIRRSAYQLLKFIVKKIKINNIGITGSLLLGGEIENFSDIDIVVYGSRNYFKIIDIISKCRKLKIRFMNRKEWSKYYDIFNVYSPFTKKIFIEHALRKRDQFILNNNIRVNLFAVRNKKEKDQLKIYNSTLLEKNIGNIKIRGYIIDNSESMFMFPSIYRMITSSGKTFIIENYIRACVLQGNLGDKVEVFGLLKRVITIDGKVENRVLITEENGGYILNLNWIKKSFYV